MGLRRRRVVPELEGGVDAFIVETFSDLVEIDLALTAIRSLTDLPVVDRSRQNDPAGYLVDPELVKWGSMVSVKRASAAL